MKRTEILKMIDSLNDNNLYKETNLTNPVLISVIETPKIKSILKNKNKKSVKNLKKITIGKIEIVKIINVKSFKMENKLNTYQNLGIKSNICECNFCIIF